MYETIFQGVFDTGTTQVITPVNYLSCVAVSLFIGIFLAGVYTYRSRYTQSFVLTLALIPAVGCMVIMLVNGNVGAGVAVAGTFSLVRFRSVPGTAKEIGAIFLAMSTGLATGMGYLGRNRQWTKRADPGKRRAWNKRRTKRGSFGGSGSIQAPGVPEAGYAHLFHCAGIFCPGGPGK